MKEGLGIHHDSHLIILYHDNSKDECLDQLAIITQLFRSV